MRRGSGTAMILACVAGLVAAPAIAGPHRALIIGNDAYADPNRLDTCVNDAQAIRQWLLMVGYQDHEITLLTDAKKADMVRALEDLVKQCRERSHEQVFIFYSGHGITIPDDDGDEGPDDPTDEGLVGVDPIRRVENEEQFKEEIDRVVLRDDQLFRSLNAIAAGTQHLIVVIDSCYSGGMVKQIDSGKAGAGKIKAIPLGSLWRGHGGGGVAVTGRASTAKGTLIDPANPSKELHPPPGRHDVVFISSSNQYQPSQTGEKYSQFTRAFLERLARARLRARGSRPLTLDLFQQDLQEILAPVPQTPLIFPIGLAKETPLLPGLFPDPDRAEIQERLAAILDRLLALAPQDRVKDWRLEAHPSVSGPLRVGTEFALQVRPEQDGHLVVFTVAADETVTFLFPNRYVPQSAVEAKIKRAIPYPRGLVIQPPVGKETYYVYWLADGHDPFKGFPIGLCGDQMPVGRLDDLARHLEGRGIRLDAASLRDAVGRGMAINPAGGTGTGERRDNGSRPVPWTRAVVTVQSIR